MSARMTKSDQQPGRVTGFTILALVSVVGTAYAQANRVALKRSVTQIWGENPDATATYTKGKTAERAGRDREAAAAYSEALKRSPKMLQALNDLAFLQAASNDPAVRSPGDATANATKATYILQDLFHKKTSKQLADTKDLTVLLLNIKASVFHTTAAARAAAGDFVRAEEYARIAQQSAQRLAKEEPTPQSRQVLSTIEENLRLFQSKQSLRGVKPITIAILE